MGARFCLARYLLNAGGRFSSLIQNIAIFCTGALNYIEFRKNPEPYMVQGANPEPYMVQGMVQLIVAP